MKENLGIYLTCEGIGDCLYAIPVIKKIMAMSENAYDIDIFTHHPNLFKPCKYISRAHSIHDQAVLEVYSSVNRVVQMFEPDKLPHHLMDTFDFMSLPLKIGALGFAEKRLEYFPSESDKAVEYDVVINSSVTWPSRTWPTDNWQRLANTLVEKGFSVAVVGKDVTSLQDSVDKKTSPAIEGCVNLINKQSLDQVYFTIQKCGVFVSCQNGLSVLAGATDSELVVLGMSIDWSFRAIYRESSPFHKISYVHGSCNTPCGIWNKCPKEEYKGKFMCIPEYSAVEEVVLAKLAQQGRTV